MSGHFQALYATNACCAILSLRFIHSFAERYGMGSSENLKQYTFDQNVSEQRDDFITNQLIAFNEAHSTALAIGQYEAQPSHIYALDADGTVVAGLVGRTHSLPTWLEVSVIWSDERVRHQGLGRQLMERAENEARQRGCRYARTATSNYQAPEFYRKLGYQLYGTLENCPPGETVFYFWKELTPEE